MNVNAVAEAIKSGRLRESLVLDEFGTKKIGDLALADQEWERNTDPQRRINVAGGVDVIRRVTPESAGTGDEELATSTERLKSAQADLAELKYAEAAGELVPAADVLREWADVLSSVRTRLLGVPTQIKQALPHLTVAEVQILEATIREALEGIVTEEIGP